MLSHAIRRQLGVRPWLWQAFYAALCSALALRAAALDWPLTAVWFAAIAGFSLAEAMFLAGRGLVIRRVEAMRDDLLAEFEVIRAQHRAIVADAADPARRPGASPPYGGGEVN